VKFFKCLNVITNLFEYLKPAAWVEQSRQFSKAQISFEIPNPLHRAVHLPRLAVVTAPQDRL
jgi:hypothetical protein